MNVRFHSFQLPRAALVGMIVLTCSVITVTGITWWRAHATARELAAVRRENAALERKLTDADSRLRKEQERLAAIDADNQRLIDAIAGGAIPSVPVATKPRLTREAIGARYQRGQALENDGDAAGALAEYLWCFDIGFRPHDLLKRIARLSANFSPARQAMIERRDRAEARVLANPNDVETMSDVIALNRALDDHERTMEVYDRIPEGAARRLQGDRSMLETFVLNQRYVDAMRVLPYEHLKDGLDRVAKLEATQAARNRAQMEIIRSSGDTEAHQQMQILAIQRAREAQRKAAVVESAVGVEILAGAGEVTKAMEIARAVLALDSSTETLALLKSTPLAGGALNWCQRCRDDVRRAASRRPRVAACLGNPDTRSRFETRRPPAA